ncbi:hypothetical protein BpHYR1_001087 [Brachionus plicatilis]|uniref:Uncharacterized protein n=1 Tax=Brachionus plicatilis TaxID=10195 RepID=A0A3M7RII4_BRAPC|nr:hypothetical protein BpHYR1_001087 [Brachionus plicatilis]
MSNLGIKNSLVNEMARKFETIARSNSSDSSNSNTGLSYANKGKRHSNDNLEELGHHIKPNSGQIAFQQVKKINNFTVTKHQDDRKNFDFDSDEINFTIKSTDSKKQSTVKRKSGAEFLKKNDDTDSCSDNAQLSSQVKQLRDQLEQINDELLDLKKKYQEFQLETETNEKIRNQQVEKLKKKIDYLLKLSFSNTFSKSVDEDHDQSEQIIKF